MFRKNWNPYVAGALVGVLAVLSVVLTTKFIGKPKYLGASTTFVRVTGLIEKTFAPKYVEENKYFKSKKVKIDWQAMLVFGIFFGALVSSLVDGSFKSEKLPPMWQEKFGDNRLKRGVVSFVGGLIAMFGVRLAGGCPSGHGLSGMMQMSVSGLVAMVFFIIAGVVVASLLYRRRIS